MMKEKSQEPPRKTYKTELKCIDGNEGEYYYFLCSLLMDGLANRYESNTKRILVPSRQPLPM